MKENDESAMCRRKLTESDGNEVSGGFPIGISDEIFQRKVIQNSFNSKEGLSML